MRKAILMLALAWACPVWAEGPVSLLELYDAARDNDPDFKAARFGHEASQQERAIGRAGLLPNVGLSSRVGQLDMLDSNQTTTDETAALNADSTTLTLSQPLYNRGAWAGYKMGVAREQLGEAEFEAATQGLYERVVDAYFSAARLENDLRLNQQQKAAIEGLARQSRRLYGAGEGVVTDIDEAQARLDLIRADAIALQASRQVALRRLSGQAGVPVSGIAAMQEQVPTGNVLSEDQDMVFWMMNAEQTSPMLRARLASVALAEQAETLAKAGHFPTLNLTAQLAKSDQSKGEQDVSQSTSYIGVVLDVPLYAGGGVSASGKRAAAGTSGARAGYEAGWQALAEDIEARYLGVASGQERARAMAAAVKSAQRALESAQKGYQGGVRTTTDILDAQQRLFEARRNLLNAKLDMLESYVMLHTRTGQMDRQVLKEVQGLY